MFPQWTAVFSALSLGLAVRAVHTKAAGNLDGIYALAKRRLPSHSYAFSFSLAQGDTDAFTISDSRTHGIHIECTTVSACARGLYTCVTPFKKLCS